MQIGHIAGCCPSGRSDSVVHKVSVNEQVARVGAADVGESTPVS